MKQVVVSSVQGQVQKEEHCVLRSKAELPVSSGSAKCFRALLAIKSSGPRLRGNLTEMINSLNSHLTHRDRPGHGTLHFTLSFSSTPYEAV